MVHGGYRTEVYRGAAPRQIVTCKVENTAKPLINQSVSGKQFPLDFMQNPA
jgi:hypothetical protein